MISELRKIYSEKGKEFIDKLFSLHVTVMEKFSGSFFAFEKIDNDTYIFYKKNSVITKVDRLVNRYYENPIRYIESLPSEVRYKIPINIKFCFQYFPDIQPNYINYKKLPKNNLILTHIVFDDNNEQKKELNTYSELLNVSIAPPIFDDILSKEQKEKIFEYLHLTKEEILLKFKTESFTKFIIEILNPSLKSTFLNDDIESPIDSIIFTFKNEDNSLIYAKLLDPIMQELISLNKKEEVKSDIISMIYAEMLEFMEIEIKNINKIYLKGITYDEKYIELISKLFNRFIYKNGKKYNEIDLKLPKFLQKNDFELNVEFINNQKTFELVNEKKIYKKLFQLFINLFYKKKKNVDDFLMDKLLIFQNELVDIIKNYIINIGECQNIPTFEKFLEFDYDNIFENNDIINESNDNSIYKIISFWQPIYLKNKTLEQKSQSINLLIGRFQPFQNGHLKILEKLYEETKKPTILIQINPDKLNDKHLLNYNQSQLMFESLKTSYNKLIKNYQIYNKKDFKVIFKNITEKYNIKTVSCKENFQNSLLKELEYFLFENGIQENIQFEFKRYDPEEIQTEEYRTQEIRKMIRDNNYVEFKKMVPECLYDIYHFAGGK